MQKKRGLQKRGHRFSQVVWASLLAGLFAITTDGTAQAAANCLSGPKGQASPGTRWHYRIDHASGRQCWYQKQIGATASRSLQTGTSAKAQTSAKPEAPAKTETPAKTDGQSTIMSRLSSAFEALTRANTTTPEPKAAEPPRKRQAQIARRPDTAKASSPKSQPATDPEAQATAPSLDPGSREALYQQFLQWRIQQLIAPE